MSDPSRNQWDMDRTESLYDEQCWREDRDELYGLAGTATEWAEFIADEGRRRAASMQFDAPGKTGPTIPVRRDVA